MNSESPTPEFTGETSQEADQARSWDELLETVRRLGDVQGSHGVISPEELAEKIIGVRDGTYPPNVITRTNGYRRAVERLLDADQLDKGGEWKVDDPEV